MVSNTYVSDLGTGALYTQTTGYVYENYSEMVRPSCYYSYKAMVLRKTLINDPLHTLIAGLKIVQKCHGKVFYYIDIVIQKLYKN